MHSNLSKIGVCRTTEGVWKDEVESDPCRWYHPFRFPNGGGEARDREGGITKELKDVEGRVTIGWKTCNLGVAESLEKGDEHG